MYNCFEYALILTLPLYYRYLHCSISWKILEMAYHLYHCYRYKIQVFQKSIYLRKKIQFTWANWKIMEEMNPRNLNNNTILIIGLHIHDSINITIVDRTNLKFYFNRFKSYYYLIIPTCLPNGTSTCIVWLVNN